MERKKRLQVTYVESLYDGKSISSEVPLGDSNFSQFISSILNVERLLISGKK